MPQVREGDKRSCELVEDLGKVWFDGEDYICGGDSHPDDGSDGNEYCCPDCGEVLFRDEDEARKFLKGEMIYYFIEHNGRKLNAFYPNDIATNPFSFSTRCWVSFDTVGEAREYIDFIKRELNTKEHPDFKKISVGGGEIPDKTGRNSPIGWGGQGGDTRRRHKRSFGATFRKRTDKRGIGGFRRLLNLRCVRLAQGKRPMLFG